MVTKRTVVVRLDSGSFDQLAAEAERRAVPPADLARDLVVSGLNGAPEAPATAAQGALAALDWLSEFRARLPVDAEVDAARLVREGRDDLDQRVGL